MIGENWTDEQKKAYEQSICYHHTKRWTGTAWVCSRCDKKIDDGPKITVRPPTASRGSQ